MFKGAHARLSLKKRKEGKEKEKGILCTIQRHRAVPFIVIFLILESGSNFFVI